MNNTNYVLTFNDIKLSVQILQLKDSYYIYIGSNNLTFNNLTLSLPSTEFIKSNPTTQIIDEEPNAIARLLSSSLSSKLNKPICLKPKINIFYQSPRIDSWLRYFIIVCMALNKLLSVFKTMFYSF